MRSKYKKKLFSRVETPKGTSSRETTSFDVLIVKIGAGVLAVGRIKQLAESLDANFRIFGGEKGYSDRDETLHMSWGPGLNYPGKF